MATGSCCSAIFSSARDVAPGVKWLRMPLGGALGFINVWAIDEGRRTAADVRAYLDELTSVSVADDIRGEYTPAP